MEIDYKEMQMTTNLIKSRIRRNIHISKSNRNNKAFIWSRSLLLCNSQCEKPQETTEKSL